MKKNWIIMLLVILSMSSPILARNTKIVLSDESGNSKWETIYEPIVVQGKNMLPMRQVFQSVGCSLVWEEENNRAVIYNYEKNKAITIIPNYNVVKNFSNNPDPAITKMDYVGDTILDIEPQNINGTLYVPVRLIEIFGNKVDFNAQNNTITIITEYKDGEYLRAEEKRIKELKQEKSKAEVEQRKESNKGKTLDLDGRVIKKGDIVNRELFSGIVEDINGSRIKVYWNYKSPVIPDRDINTWAMLSGIKYNTSQWIDSNKVLVEY
ncbi:stalk domain-containing protein [Clostridium sp.]|uniref:stalk domain-containing protein n=1 Tax=Clostridium sp. TaxID=1506 RepID=UPI003F39EF46